jgi:hypothetical protein
MQGIRGMADAALTGSNVTGNAVRQPRQLWFNASNKSDEPPDVNHVITLPARLSGTLITMAWTTDPALLRSTISNETPRT